MIRLWGQRLGLVWLSTLVLFAVQVSAASAEKSEPLLAIVIDDLGDNRAKGLAAIHLPGKITYAFLPHTPYAAELARKADALGKEVILHAPMENKSGLRLGPGALEDHHTLPQLNSILNADLDSIPNVMGMNNHMGSLLTEDREKMETIMHVMRERNMFFLDSVTTSNTVAWKVAREYGVPYLLRDVFLDNEQKQDYIHNQFKQALKKAVDQGDAVLIGHPYPATIAYLEKVLPVIERLGVRLVSASEMIRLRSEPKELLVNKTVNHCDSYEGHCLDHSLGQTKNP